MKTFLLMLASAFMGVVLFVVAVWGYFYYQYSRLGPEFDVRLPSKAERTIAVAPPVSDAERFYGTHGSYIGEFADKSRQTVLAAGPGKIAASVTVDGKPLAGFRVRLALNGAAMSQWATSGADGRYEVAVPYGKYRVDGYELDSTVANKLLAGKTDGPRQGPWGRETIEVAAGKPGEGIDLGFVDPVRVAGPRGDVSAAKPVIVSWQAYAGASAYRLQLIEMKARGDFDSRRRLFEWREQPVVSGTSANLAEHKVALKKGYYYAIELEALDERKRVISQSARSFERSDFRVVD